MKKLLILGFFMLISIIGISQQLRVAGGIGTFKNNNSMNLEVGYQYDKDIFSIVGERTLDSGSVYSIGAKYLRQTNNDQLVCGVYGVSALYTLNSTHNIILKPLIGINFLANKKLGFITYIASPIQDFQKPTWEGGIQGVLKF